MAFGDLKGTFQGSATSIGTSLAITTGGPVAVIVGDLVYALCAEQAAITNTACADNLGNVYAPVKTPGADAGTIVTGRAYVARITIPGSITTVTFTANGGSSNVVGLAQVIEGPFAPTTVSQDANPADILNDVTTFTGPATGTLGQAAEVVLSWLVVDGNETLTATSPNLLSATLNTATILTAAIGHQTVAATTTVAPDWASTAGPAQSALGTTSYRRFLDQPPSYQPPNPVLRVPPRTEIKAQPDVWQNLQSTLFGPRPPISVDDTSIPVRPPSRGAAMLSQDGVWQNLLSTLLAPAAVVSYIFRGPLAVPRWLQPVREAVPGFVAAGLALATVAAPFTSAWANPQTEPRDASALTWLNPINLNLIGQDTIYGDPGEVPSYSWPNPRGPAQANQDYQQSLNVALLTTTGTKPFLQVEWPVPRGQPSRQDYQQSVNQNLSPAETVVVLRQPLVTRFVAPSRFVAITATINRGSLVVPESLPAARQQDWPNPLRPIRRPDYQFSVNVNLYGQDAVFGPTIWGQPRDIPHDGIVEQFPVGALRMVVIQAPFAQTDWPNPRQVWPRPDYQQAVNLGLLTTTGTKPFAQNDWPGSRGARRPVADAAQGTNLALNGVPTPFSQDDWPNPSRRPIYRLVADPPNITSALLPPFSQDDWPNPRRAGPRADYQQSLNLGLRTTTGTKPFLQAEWPVPLGAKPVVADYQQSVNLALFTTPPSPFAQDDWPNPRGYAPRPDYQQALNLGLRTTTGTKPFAQSDWPVTRAVPPRQSYQQPGNYLLLVPPFGQDDWPVPRGHGPRQSYQQQLNLGLRTTTGTKPFLQSDWPVPKGARPVVVGEQRGINLALVVTPPAPFSQDDWPNPRGYPPRQDYQQGLDLAALLTKPFAQTEWPNPRGYPPRQDHHQSLDLALLLTRPFIQTEWPNPRGHPPRPYYQQSVDLGLLTTTGTKPFAQYDWPDPKGYPPRPYYLQPSDMELLGIPDPFHQTEWPVPKGAQPIVVGERRSMNLALVLIYADASTITGDAMEYTTIADDAMGGSSIRHEGTEYTTMRRDRMVPL